ncbi:MAG: M15 family metallopeptidase [Pseudomonadota bacterium]
MINSRDLNELCPPAKRRVEAFLAACKAEGIDLLVTSTYRDAAAQDALYAQGRTAKGLVVTNARAGESWHNWRCAADVVPLRHGKPVWGTSGIDGELWRKVGEIGESCGLEWAGRWSGKLKETAHFQYTGGLTLAQLKNGAAIA